MTRALPLLLLLASAPPERALYLFELRGSPAGTVELSWDRAGGQFTYRSTHLFTRGADRSRRVRVERLAVGADGRLPTGEWPSALWLWRKPKPGCERGHEELGGRSGPLCAGPADDAGRIRGTMFGDPFAATFSAEDRLETLEVEGARFTAVPLGTRAAWPRDLFAEGFPISGGAGRLALEPPLPAEARVHLPAEWDERAARELAREVHESIPDKRPSAADLSESAGGEAGSCLAHARRFVRLARERGKSAAVVHGLVAERGEARAWPHVWVRVVRRDGRVLDLDPTSLDEVTPETHLPLAVEEAGEPPGAVWMKLLSGRYGVVRRK